MYSQFLPPVSHNISALYTLSPMYNHTMHCCYYHVKQLSFTSSETKSKRQILFYLNLLLYHSFSFLCVDLGFWTVVVFLPKELPWTFLEGRSGGNEFPQSLFSKYLYFSLTFEENFCWYRVQGCFFFFFLAIPKIFHFTLH